MGSRQLVSQDDKHGGLMLWRNEVRQTDITAWRLYALLSDGCWDFKVKRGAFYSSTAYWLYFSNVVKEGRVEATTKHTALVLTCYGWLGLLCQCLFHPKVRLLKHSFLHSLFKQLAKAFFCFVLKCTSSGGGGRKYQVTLPDEAQWSMHGHSSTGLQSTNPERKKGMLPKIKRHL